MSEIKDITPSPVPPKRIAVFASGRGSNFGAIVSACHEGLIPNAQVVLCITDNPGALVTKLADIWMVPVIEFKPKDFPHKAAYESMLLEELKKAKVDLICLAGYMRIVGKTLLAAFPNRILNIHPSLLPAFPGVDAIGQAMAYGVKVYGVTVHFVDETLDGGKIIGQDALIYYGNDRDFLEPKIHEIEHRLYPEVISRVLSSFL